jgi:toxin ParE1/3/4
VKGGKPVILRQRAELDITEAIDRYLDEASAQVAQGFVDALEQAFRPINRQPAAGSPRWGHALGLEGLRAWPLSRYPYLVFYLERSDHLDVWRVLHGQRDVPSHLSDG